MERGGGLESGSGRLDSRSCQVEGFSSLKHIALALGKLELSPQGPAELGEFALGIRGFCDGSNSYAIKN